MVTYNNPTHSAKEFLDLFTPHVAYMAFQHEVGKKGTPHFQIYMYMKKPVRITALHKICPGLAVKVKYAKSTPEQCRNYCMKAETRTEGPWEIGTCPITEKGTAGQGRRKDLEEVHAAIKTGASYAQILDLNPSAGITYHGGIKAAIRAQPPPKKLPPKVTWLWGETGTGKSYRAYNENDIDIMEVCLSNPDKARTFEQYTGQARFIFDDYSPDQLSHGDIKRYLDKYPIMVKTMYDTRHFTPSEIYVTCSYPPSQYWSGNKLAEIERRCTEGVHELKEIWVAPGTQEEDPILIHSSSASIEDIEMPEDPEISLEELIALNNLKMSNARLQRTYSDESLDLGDL